MPKRLRTTALDCHVLFEWALLLKYEKLLIGKMFAEMDTYSQFHFTSNFYAHGFQMHKKTVKSAVSFCTFGTYERKSCS